MAPGHWKGTVIEALLVTITSLVTGLIIGFVQGYCSFMFSSNDHFRLLMAEGVAKFGGVVALPLGIILYYTLLRGYLTFRSFVIGFGVCLGFVLMSTTVLAFLIGSMAWVSVFATPVVAIAVALLIRFDINLR